MNEFLRAQKEKKLQKMGLPPEAVEQLAEQEMVVERFFRLCERKMLKRKLFSKKLTDSERRRLEVYCANKNFEKRLRRIMNAVRPTAND